MEIFWNTIAQYNEATWWAQLLITAAGILLAKRLYRKPTLWAKRALKIYMVFLNGWISIVYYMMYCGARGHHHILAIFWGVIALLWLWDLFTDYTPFERNPKYKVLVGILYAMPFLYPLLSWARGMEFPMMTTTVMPLLGSCVHHRAAAGFLAQGQPARHSVPLPLGAHRLSKSTSTRFPKTCCWQAPPCPPSICSSRTTLTRTCTRKPSRVHGS